MKSILLVLSAVVTVGILIMLSVLPSSPFLLEVQFEEIKSHIRETGYDVCAISLEDDKIIIDLNWIFEGTSQEKEIISKIQFYFDYEIVYHEEGYTDFFIGKNTANTCKPLEYTDKSTAQRIHFCNPYVQFLNWGPHVACMRL